MAVAGAAQALTVDVTWASAAAVLAGFVLLGFSALFGRTDPVPQPR